MRSKAFFLFSSDLISLFIHTLYLLRISTVLSHFSSSDFSIFLRKALQYKGLLPEVEIPTVTLFLLTSAGKINPHFSLSSTVFIRIFLLCFLICVYTTSNIYAISCYFFWICCKKFCPIRNCNIVILFILQSF